jgi:glucokinase
MTCDQPTSLRVLTGDIGGTKTRLAIIVGDGGRLLVEREQVFPSRDYPAFTDLLGEFLQHSVVPSRASFGIAGPVTGRLAHTTNLPWRIDADVLEKEFGLESCALLNDLEAAARGLPALGKDDLVVLNEGAPNTNGNAAIIAPGTGLGEAGLYWDGREYHPYATEGGHASFSPQDEKEVALLLHLQRLHGHVSWERVLSGPGLVSLHEFHCLYCNVPVPDWVQHDAHQGGAAASIANAALNGSDELCVSTLAWFVRLLGAEAGNLALKAMSRGGLYLGGGIPPKILPCLQTEPFLEAFFRKGRMRPLLETIPVTVIMNDQLAIYGAALHASMT